MISAQAERLIELMTQGIAPTLIAFRVAEEKPRAEGDDTSQTSPLSHIRFRRSSHGGDVESGDEHNRMSTIRAVTVDREEHGDSMYFGVSSDGGLPSTEAGSTGQILNVAEQKTI